MNGNFKSSVDVCFILEGTYPFVSGGVSTWVHQAISTMPDLSFSIHYIGAQAGAVGESKYDVPSNVVSIEKVFIFDNEAEDCDQEIDSRIEDEMQQAFDLLFASFQSTDRGSEFFRKAVSQFEKVAAVVPFEIFWKHSLTWEYLQKAYRSYYPGESFASCFWNTRFILKPVWELLRSFSRLPRARVYHSVSTGYAGFLGAVAKYELDRPFLLSEHGIYVRERITDLLNQEWSPTLAADFARPPAGVSLMRQTWIDLFIHLGRFCYDSADHITSLFERNARFQEEFGADRDKIEIIPNGINPGRFRSIEKKREDMRKSNPERKTVGFLGRIVSIKDVKTLIRAAKHVCDEISDAEFLLVGPTDEDPEYFESCQALIRDLNLDSRVTLTGPKKLEEALPLFDIMVLSSISEGLPFAVLESFAANIPVVSTDVGSCSELIHGFSGNELPGGIVVPVADAAQLAEAIITLLKDRSLQNTYGNNGKERVYRCYQEEDVMRRFQNHYIRLGQQTTEQVH